MYSSKAYWARHPYSQANDPKLKEHLRIKAEAAKAAGVTWTTKEFRDFLDWCDQSHTYDEMKPKDIGELNNNLAIIFGFSYNGVNQFTGGDPDVIYNKLIELYPRLKEYDSYYHIKRQYVNELYDISLRKAGVLKC